MLNKYCVSVNTWGTVKDSQKSLRWYRLLGAYSVIGEAKMNIWSKIQHYLHDHWVKETEQCVRILTNTERGDGTSDKSWRRGNLKSMVHIHWGEEDHQWNRTVGEGQNVSFGHAKFERLIGHPSGDTHPNICRQLREVLWVRDINWRQSPLVSI